MNFHQAVHAERTVLCFSGHGLAQVEWSREYVRDWQGIPRPGAFSPLGGCVPASLAANPRQRSDTSTWASEAISGPPGTGNWAHRFLRAGGARPGRATCPALRFFVGVGHSARTHAAILARARSWAGFETRSGLGAGRRTNSDQAIFSRYLLFSVSARLASDSGRRCTYGSDECSLLRRDRE